MPSERVFSTAGNTVTKKRSCLLSDNVDKLVFLHKYFKSTAVDSTDNNELVVKEEPMPDADRPIKIEPDTESPALPQLGHITMSFGLDILDLGC